MAHALSVLGGNNIEINFPGIFNNFSRIGANDYRLASRPHVQKKPTYVLFSQSVTCDLHFFSLLLLTSIKTSRTCFPKYANNQSCCSSLSRARSQLKSSSVKSFLSQPFPLTGAASGNSFSNYLPIGHNTPEKTS